MNKKILMGLLVIICLFTVTSCSNSNGTKLSKNGAPKEEFVDLKYDKPKGTTKREESINSDNYKVLNYYFDDSEKNIKLIYNKSTDKSYIISDDDYTEKEINSIKWYIVHNKDFGIEYDTYCTEYNNDLYIIELNKTDVYSDDFLEFMNEVTF